MKKDKKKEATKHISKKEKREAQEKDPNNSVSVSVLTSRLLFKKHYLNTANASQSNNLLREATDEISRCRKNGQLQAKEIQISKKI